jgi:hypothetical protein
MATPIRWNNVNIRSGAEAASLGSTAAQFGRTAQAGFAGLATRLRARSVEDRAREDQLMTNEAISAALSGGPTVSSNRRVDPLALQKAVQSQGLYKEDIETSDLSQTGLGLTNRINQFKADNQQEVHGLNMEATRLAMEADKSTIGRNNFANDVAQWNFENQQRIADLDEKQRVNVEALNSYEFDLEEQYRQDELTGLSNPSQEDINRATMRARARVQGPEGELALKSKWSDLGGSSTGFAATFAGGRGALADAAAAREAEREITRQNELYAASTQWERDINDGYFGSSINDGAGNLIPTTPKELKRQKEAIGNPGKALQFLNANGVNIQNLEDEDKDAIEEVRAAFPASSLFMPVVRSWVEPDGALDRKGLRNALATGQRDILLARAGLSTEQGPADGPGGPGVNVDTSTSQERLISRFKEVQARLKEKKNLPTNVKIDMVKAFEGAALEGGKSLLTETDRVNSLEQLEAWLDYTDSRAGKRQPRDTSAQTERLQALNKALNEG